MKLKSIINIRGVISFLFFTSLVLAGCEKIDLGKEIDIKIGQEYNINWGTSFSVDSINDYRCPSDVICIWGGDVDLFFHINHGFEKTDTLIYLNTRDRNPFTIGNFTWKVLEVNPLPLSGRITDQKDYSVKILITKK